MDAALFDPDGVIVDSEPVWEEVRRAYVAAHGGTWQPDTQRRLMGMSTGEWAAYLSGEPSVDRSPEQVATEVVAEMTRRYAEHVPLIDDADAVVRRMAGRWPLGLASSSPTRLIAAALAATGLTDAFGATLSTEETARGKPAPDVWLAVAARLGVDPARCVAIEDSSNGVRSAAAAGMRVIAVPHGSYVESGQRPGPGSGSVLAAAAEDGTPGPTTAEAVCARRRLLRGRRHPQDQAVSRPFPGRLR